MSIISFHRDAGPSNTVKPASLYLYADDALSVIATAGYLNPFIKSEGLVVEATDFVFAVGSDGHQIYKPVINAGTGVITLTVLP